MKSASIEGVWRLLAIRVSDADGKPVASQYGDRPMGQITLSDNRILAPIWGDDSASGASKAYNAYGGRYALEGDRMVITIDVASHRPSVGSRQVRVLALDGDRMSLRTPVQAYGTEEQQREFSWERVWRPSA